MENFIIYLGKASILLAIFFLPYYFLLRKETFFNANRWFLLTGIVASLALPLFVFTKIIFVEPIANNLQTPFANAFEIAPTEVPDFAINWFYFAFGAYFIGVCFFFVKFAKDIFSLWKILKQEKSIKQGNFRFIDTDKIHSPFSFFNYIVYNSNTFSQEELENIIAHEKVHSLQFHSADMILGQFLCIFFWFNPFAWLHQKALAQNLEFIADSVALKQVSDRINYQKTLLKVSAPHLCIPVTNHFYQSLIKKRIVMLNKNQSKRRNSWKYATVFPLITIFMLQFQVETVAQVKESVVVNTKFSESDTKKINAVMVLNNASDQELESYFSRFQKDNNVAIRFEAKRNSAKEIIWLKLFHKNNKGKQNENIFGNSKSPISSLLIEWDENKNNLKISELGTAEESMAVAAVAIAEPNSEENKDNVVAHVTEKEDSPQASGFSMSFKTSSSENIIENSMNNPSIDAINAVTVVDGKVVTAKEFEALNQNEIKSISVIGKSSPMIGKWVEKYGEKAKSGVIIIETKEEPVYGVDATKDAKLINDNSGFLIDKNSKESDLEFYKSEFSKSNIIFKYKVKRNNSNKIKSLSLEISDKIGGTKQVVTRIFEFHKEEQVIPEVFVGRREGSLVISVTKKD